MVGIQGYPYALLLTTLPVCSSSVVLLGNRGKPASFTRHRHMALCFWTYSGSRYVVLLLYQIKEGVSIFFRRLWVKRYPMKFFYNNFFK